MEDFDTFLVLKLYSFKIIHYTIHISIYGKLMGKCQNLFKKFVIKRVRNVSDNIQTSPN